jgi:glycosyltransferase involved in cell wall biosynthesis
LPRQSHLLVYAGQLYPWKGVDVLVESLASLRDVQLVIVGGDKRNLPRMRALADEHAPGRVHFAGPVPHFVVPRYLAAADAIILPNSGNEEISQRYTSPLKLFEAMAARRPIVASDLPSLREVLRDGENARLFKADDAPALARGIRDVLDNASSAELAQQAAQDVTAFSWARRGTAVARFLRDRLAVAG